MILAPALLLSAALAPQHVVHTFTGNRPKASFGNGVSSAGDVDGDGYADLISGAKDDDTMGPEAGSAWVYSGRTGALLYGYYGAAPHDLFGAYVAGLGDLNHDGHDEFAVGAKQHDGNGTDAGLVTVYSGSDGALLYALYGDGPNDYFGMCIEPVDDVDRDGTPDFIIGAHEGFPTNQGNGYARVYSGASAAPIFTVRGDDLGDFFGKFAGGAGDVNRDGWPDFLVGAKEDDNNGNDSGSCQLFSGRDATVLAEWNGTKGSWFGTTVTGVGDVNGDGYPDILVGAYRTDVFSVKEAGALYIFSGFDYSPIHVIPGDDAYDWFSKSADGVGDVDGDGLADFASGAYQDDDNGQNSGSVKVYSGATGQVIYTFHGSAAEDHFGFSVHGAGDVDGDGIYDLIVGANNALPSDAGAAQVFSMWTLVLEIPQPGIAGQSNSVAVRGATPGGTVAFTTGFAEGVYMVPACLPAGLSLADPRNLFTRTADAAGVASLTVQVPPGVSGVLVLIQAVDLASCTASNLVHYTFP